MRRRIAVLVTIIIACFGVLDIFLLRISGHLNGGILGALFDWAEGERSDDEQVPTVPYTPEKVPVQPESSETGADYSTDTEETEPPDDITTLPLSIELDENAAKLTFSVRSGYEAAVTEGVLSWVAAKTDTGEEKRYPAKLSEPLYPGEFPPGKYEVWLEWKDDQMDEPATASDIVGFSVTGRTEMPYSYLFAQAEITENERHKAYIADIGDYSADELQWGVFADSVEIGRLSPVEYPELSLLRAIMSSDDIPDTSVYQICLLYGEGGDTLIVSNVLETGVVYADDLPPEAAE